MLGWFAELNPKERRTMGACFGGWALDAFDVQMYSFVIPTVIALWGLSRGQAGLIGTVTLLISSVGGWFSGTLADRFGRVRMLQITILWYSVFTFLCAFAQNFEQLFILRALHGLGFGGEWAAGAVLMGEVIRDKYRGRGVGIVQTGWAVGWVISALVYTALYAFLPEAIAGRRLCPWDLDADLPAHGARIVGNQYWRVSTGPDPWCANGLSAGLLSERCDRPEIDVYAVRDR